MRSVRTLYHRPDGRSFLASREARGFNSAIIATGGSDLPALRERRS
jgi:hypothetical protein